MPDVTLPHGFQVRHTTMDDLEAVTDLVYAYERANYGANAPTRESVRENIRSLWEGPGMDLATNAWVMCASNGQCVGRVNLWFSEHKPEELYASPRVHPAYNGLGIGTYLIQLAEERARQLMEEIPPGEPVTLNSWIDAINERAAALITQQEFQPLRYYWRMVIEMTEPPPEPVWPESIRVRTMMPGQDDRAVFEAFNEAFADHWGHTPEDFEEWSHWNFAQSTFDPSLWFLVMDGSQLAGFASCELDSEEAQPVGVVGDLAVRRAWRKQGLGLALLHHAFGEFYRRGITKCALSVDSQNLSGATRLYERAGMHRGKRVDVRYVKELRA